jgi:biopolymer transport protein ExbD
LSARTTPSKTPIVEINKSGVLKMDGETITLSQLTIKLRQLSAASHVIYLRPERDVAWSLVYQISNSIETSRPGFHISLMLPDGKSA